MRYYVEAYGCTMNQGETKILVDSLMDESDTVVDSPEKGDIAVIGTCVVLTKTEKRMWRRIKKIRSKTQKVIVSGCLASTQDEKLKDLYEDIDIKKPSDIEIKEKCHHRYNKYDYNSPIGIIPISSGCTGNCNYCITKLARGNLRSRNPSLIKKMFQRYMDSQKKEIQLACQDTASYGLDIGTDLPELLKMLTEEENDEERDVEDNETFRIRVGMMNIDSVEPILDRTLSAMSEDKIYSFLHLPLQSASNKVLEAMNREYTKEDWISVVESYKEKLPDLTLSTDIIVGFPGEKDSDFQRTKELLKSVEPDIVNVTRFSPRPGTRAEEMKEKVHSRIKKERSKELTDLRLDISSRVNEEFVGREEKVLVTEKGKKSTIKARMNNYKMVIIDDYPGRREDLLGEWIKVRIVDSKDVYLVGKIIDQN